MIKLSAIVSLAAYPIIIALVALALGACGARQPRVVTTVYPALAPVATFSEGCQCEIIVTINEMIVTEIK